MLSRIYCHFTTPPLTPNAIYFDQTGQAFSYYPVTMAFSSRFLQTVKAGSLAHKQAVAVVPDPWMIDKVVDEFSLMCEDENKINTALQIGGVNIYTFAADPYIIQLYAGY